MKYNCQVYTLEQVCKRIYSGGTPSTTHAEYWGGDINWLSSGETGQRYVKNTIKKITPLGVKNSTTKLAKKGSIVVASAGQGYTRGQASFLLVDTYVNQSIIVFEADEKIILPRYLYYNLDNRYEEFRLLSDGTSTRGGLSGWIVKRMEINVPPVNIQERVVTILQDIDEKIELNNAINDNLQQQALALFKATFVDSPNVTNWQIGKLADLIESTISGDWGKDSPIGNNSEMVYCIRGADIPEVRKGNKGKMPVRYVLPKNFYQKRLMPGDIVVEISGGSPTQSTGRVAAISSALLNRYDRGMVCTNFCKAIKSKCEYSMFVYHYWQYLYDKGVFFSYENGTTGIKNLDLAGIIDTEQIYIPPFELVKRFNAICQSYYNQIYANGQENEHLATLRDSLLPKLMSGEIDVSDVEIDA